MTIETSSLKLIGGNVAILEAAIEGDAALSRILAVQIQDEWTEFGVHAFRFSLAILKRQNDQNGWLTYFPIHKLDNKLIGSCGYKGAPTPDGVVEIGYEIAPAYRNRGLATELASGLVANAFKNPNVQVVCAHTLGYESASTSILKKCGFEFVEPIDDPEDGLIWKWELKRKI